MSAPAEIQAALEKAANDLQDSAQRQLEASQAAAERDGGGTQQ